MSVNLVLLDRNVNLIEEEIDVALRVAELPEVPSDLAPKSVKTTMAGISWMWRSHYIW